MLLMDGAMALMLIHGDRSYATRPQLLRESAAATAAILLEPLKR
jgi:hypothetical protein